MGVANSIEYAKFAKEKDLKISIANKIDELIIFSILLGRGPVLLNLFPLLFFS